MKKEGIFCVSTDIQAVIKHFPIVEIDDVTRTRHGISEVRDLTKVMDKDKVLVHYIEENYPGFIPGGYVVCLNNGRGYVTPSLTGIDPRVKRTV